MVTDGARVNSSPGKSAVRLRPEAENSGERFNPSGSVAPAVLSRQLVAILPEELPSRGVTTGSARLCRLAPNKPSTSLLGGVYLLQTS
jgi:hypothetical protein